MLGRNVLDGGGFWEPADVYDDEHDVDAMEDLLEDPEFNAKAEERRVRVISWSLDTELFLSSYPWLNRFVFLPSLVTGSRSQQVNATSVDCGRESHVLPAQETARNASKSQRHHTVRCVTRERSRQQQQ